MSARVLAIAGLVLSGCTLVTGLPDVEPEESAPACANGIDDDLDGEPDCADRSCRDFCWEAANLLVPELTPCFANAPNGLAFRAVELDSTHQRCEPDPDPASLCGEGEHLVPGAPACRRPGRACDEEEWPAVPDGAEPVVYVRAGASGGDGSAEAPWGTIADALASAPADARVLLSAGEHLVPDLVDRSIDLRGACAGRTILRGHPRVAASARLDLRDVTLVALGELGATALHVGGDAWVEGVEIRGALRVEGEGARLDLADVSVTPSTGTAVTARDGAHLHVGGSTIAYASGGVALDGATAQLVAVAVRGTQSFGVRVAGDSTIATAGLVVEPGAGVGIELACDAGDERCADLDHTIVRFPLGLPEAGEGIVVASGRARLRRAHVARPRDAALRVGAAFVELEDSILEGAEVGGGIRVGAGGALVAQRVFLWDNRPRGIAIEAGGRVTAVDLDVLGSTRSASADVCVEALGGSAVGATRFVLESCGICGLRLEDEVDLVLNDGLVVGSSRGACLARDATYPLGSLTSHVTYRDNESSNLFRE